METMLPMTAEAIKITEKKMNMTLDDIIKMSKNSSLKARKFRSSRRGGQGSRNRGTFQGKSSKVQCFQDSRTAVWQELLSQRRLNSKGQGQPPVAEHARSVAVAPVCDTIFTYHKDEYHRMPRPAYGPFQTKAIEAGISRKVEAAKMELRPGWTLDSLFANMKAQRVRMTCRRRWNQMQQGQPSGVTGRAIVGQRRERAMTFLHKSSRVEARWLHCIVFGTNKKRVSLQPVDCFLVLELLDPLGADVLQGHIVVCLIIMLVAVSSYFANPRSHCEQIFTNAGSIFWGNYY